VKEYHTLMESPILETRACPSCPGLIADADPHHLCFEYLGPDHAVYGVKPSPSCSACRVLLQRRRQHQWEHFQTHYVSPRAGDTDDQEELDVVEMGDQDMAGEVPFTFAIPAARMAPFPGEEDDEDSSLSGTSGSGFHEGLPPRSVHKDFPLVITMAAERVGPCPWQQWGHVTCGRDSRRSLGRTVMISRKWRAEGGSVPAAREVCLATQDVRANFHLISNLYSSRLSLEIIDLFFKGDLQQLGST